MGNKSLEGCFIARAFEKNSQSGKFVGGFDNREDLHTVNSRLSESIGSGQIKLEDNTCPAQAEEIRAAGLTFNCGHLAKAVKRCL
jgi:hypothetical protein